MSAAQLAPEVRPADPDRPERVTIHSRLEDPAEAALWGVLPGTAVCGFIFTSKNYVGPGPVVEANPGFVTKRCPSCLEWLAFARMVVDLEAPA